MEVPFTIAIVIIAVGFASGLAAGWNLKSIQLSVDSFHFFKAISWLAACIMLTAVYYWSNMQVVWFFISASIPILIGYWLARIVHTKSHAP